MLQFFHGSSPGLSAWLLKTSRRFSVWVANPATLEPAESPNPWGVPRFFILVGIIYFSTIFAIISEICAQNMFAFFSRIPPEFVGGMTFKDIPGPPRLDKKSEPD